MTIKSIFLSMILTIISLWCCNVSAYSLVLVNKFGSPLTVKVTQNPQIVPAFPQGDFILEKDGKQTSEVEDDGLETHAYISVSENYDKPEKRKVVFFAVAIEDEKLILHSYYEKDIAYTPVILGDTLTITFIPENSSVHSKK